MLCPGLCPVQGDLIVLIAAAFSLGTALDQTGAAKEIADSLIDLLAPLGGAGILAGYGEKEVHMKNCWVQDGHFAQTCML